MYEPIGYWVTCDEALCSDCFDRPGYDWPGFETWAEPLAIFSDTESDTPTHCDRCETLIEHALTPDGYRYVMEAVAGSYVKDGGRRCITKAWWSYYGDEIVADIERWPDTDEFSPPTAPGMPQHVSHGLASWAHHHGEGGDNYHEHA